MCMRLYWLIDVTRQKSNATYTTIEERTLLNFRTRLNVLKCLFINKKQRSFASLVASVPHKLAEVP